MLVEIEKLTIYLFSLAAFVFPSSQQPMQKAREKNIDVVHKQWFILFNLHNIGS